MYIVYKNKYGYDIKLDKEKHNSPNFSSTLKPGGARGKTLPAFT